MCISQTPYTCILVFDPVWSFRWSFVILFNVIINVVELKSTILSSCATCSWLIFPSCLPSFRLIKHYLVPILVPFLCVWLLSFKKSALSPSPHVYIISNALSEQSTVLIRVCLQRLMTWPLLYLRLSPKPGEFQRHWICTVHSRSTLTLTFKALSKCSFCSNTPPSS